MLLYVVQHNGSSPGREGFSMAVDADGQMCGTIGGGVMEYKLVEMSKVLLAKGQHNVKIMKQFHDKQQPHNQSGMICSGEQTIAFLPLLQKDLAVVDLLLRNKKQCFRLSPQGLEVVQEEEKLHLGFRFLSENDWSYTSKSDKQRVVHIIGAGHTALALSEVLRFTGFYIKLYDDRPELNTFVANTFAHEKQTVDYAQIARILQPTPDDFVVLMTIGYRDDKRVLVQLLDKKVFYLGMLGSKAKIRTLFAELEAEGYNPQSWQHVFTPIGIDIRSQTVQEIAISIAAQMIKVLRAGE